MRLPSIRTTLPLLAGCAALAGCYGYEQGPRGAAPMDRVPAARITGPDQSCVGLRQFDQTVVRDERTIDFLTGSRRGWRNVLPASCPGLARERAFSFNTSLSQLCSTDIVHVLENWGGSLRPGAACGLGQFTPIELTR